MKPGSSRAAYSSRRISCRFHLPPRPRYDSSRTASRVTRNVSSRNCVVDDMHPLTMTKERVSPTEAARLDNRVPGALQRGCRLRLRGAQLMAADAGLTRLSRGAVTGKA